MGGRRGFRGVVTVVALLVVLAGCDWSAYLGGPEHTSWSWDGRVATTDVAGLTRSWRWHPANITGRPGSIFSTPVTWNDRVFQGANNGNLVALDLATGKQLWSRDFGYQPQLTCNAMGVASTPAVRVDASGTPIVYLNAPDGYLYALDGRTGANVWRTVVQIPSTTSNDSFAWASPTVANGRVYVGIASGCDTPFVRGGVKAYDQTTGALLATGWTIPSGYAGAGVWTSPAADANGLYVTTGSTTSAVDQAHRSTTTNGFDQYSLVKLDPITLAPVAKWPAPDSPVGDPDFGSSPVLFHATVGGVSTQLVGACNKDGNFYALRADTMTPVWTRLVGTADAAGETGCLSGAVWDGSHLFVAGNTTTIAGASAPGSVRNLDPATGAVIWETALGANPLGSGSVNPNGILAYAATDWNGGSGNGVYLVDANDGTVLRVLHDVGSFPEFAQPVFAAGRILAADTDALVAWSP